MELFTAKQYLQIDIANLYGKDKLSWSDRLAWFQENQDKLLDLVESADSPNQYYAAVVNYNRVKDGGINHHPIALDATSSGTQILSCLIGDEKAASYCNVINSGKRVDAYKELFNKLPDEVKADPNITRDKIKKAIMTSLYGSMVKPKELFGDFVEDFYELMAKECPIIWILNNFLCENWNNKISSYGWVMPDNFHVDIKIHELKTFYFNFLDKQFSFDAKVNGPSEYGRAYSANLAHSCDSLIVREITALAMHNPKQIQKVKDLLKSKTTGEGSKENFDMVSILVDRYKASGFLSARVLKYIDAGNINLVPEEELNELLDLVPAKPFEVLCIHDSFKVLPNYGNDLRKLYIAQLAKIAKSNLLQFILDQFLEHPPKVTKGNPELYKQILNTEYALS